VLAVPHVYACYEAVRHARQLVQTGALGEVHSVQVEYPQQWLATPIEASGNPQALWRSDPALSGGGCVADIGCHAAHLAEFVAGKAIVSLSAVLSTAVPGRMVDDGVQAILRLEGGVTGGLWASQVAWGYENDIRIRVMGSLGALEWMHMRADELRWSPANQTTELLSFSQWGSELGAASPHCPRDAPAYERAFARFYSETALSIQQASQPSAELKIAYSLPSAQDAARAVAFVQACQISSKRAAQWVSMADFLK
jgi:predicted dehydrogenase